MRTFLAKYSPALVWVHTILSLGLLTFPWIALRLQAETELLWILAAGVLSVIGAAQNIGIVHEFAHRIPRGPKWLGRAVAAFAHALGGLVFEKARTAHQFHHAFLGKDQDPDRHGYDHTTEGLFRRFRYLLMIGPIRGVFAPVELKPLIDKLAASEQKRFHAYCWRDRLLLVVTQGVLLAVLGPYYVGYFACLITANMLSNVREMTEHGNGGKAAYVNVRPSLIGVLFFSTPGFWYHGAHHIRPEVPYWALPLKAEGIQPHDQKPLLHRRSYLKFMLTGG
jgi:fatty acid desaturase